MLASFKLELKSCVKNIKSVRNARAQSLEQLGGIRISVVHNMRGQAGFSAGQRPNVKIMHTGHAI